MKFEDFFEKLEKDTVPLFKKYPQTRETQDKIVNAWTLYQTIKTNKSLVIATWALTIFTMILSGLTLYFQYFK